MAVHTAHCLSGYVDDQSAFLKCLFHCLDSLFVQTVCLVVQAVFLAFQTIFPPVFNCLSGNIQNLLIGDSGLPLVKNLKVTIIISSFVILLTISRCHVFWTRGILEMGLLVLKNFEKKIGKFLENYYNLEVD